MSEYEQVQLFYEILRTGNASISNYMLLVIALMIMAYLVAHKTKPLTMYIALTIYSLTAAQFINEIIQIYADLARLAAQIQETGQDPDTSLKWFGPTLHRSGSMNTIPIFVALVAILSYIASIIYCFRVRYVHLREQDAVGRKNVATL